MDKKTIKAAWESFEEAVLPADVPRTQYTEMRRAFYAGAHVAIHILANIGDDSVSEDAGVKLFEQLMAETDAFSFQVMKGQK